MCRFTKSFVLSMFSEIVVAVSLAATAERHSHSHVKGCSFVGKSEFVATLWDVVDPYGLKKSLAKCCEL